MKNALLISLLAAVHCLPQSTQKVDDFGTAPAVQVFDALGTNITSTHEWEYKAARASHMKWVRFDCPWQTVEMQQLPENVSRGYSLPDQCAVGLTFSRMYGVSDFVNALYGAPYNQIAEATTVLDAPVGAMELSLSFTAGNPRAMVPGRTYARSGPTPISAKHAYAGTLISANNAGTIGLASATTRALPKGSHIVINLQLYPPVSINAQSSYLENASLQAYGAYVHFLQRQLADTGTFGRVSIWNEPPWEGDPWDVLENLYDHPRAERRISADTGIELAAYVSHLPLVDGVKLDNGFTNKSGSGSLMVQDQRTNLLAGIDVARSFASESFHPYGNNPEDSAWIADCPGRYASSSTRAEVFRECTPEGLVVGSNVKWQDTFYEAARAQGRKTPDLSITETGICRCSQAVSEAQVTRFDIRQFLTFSGLGVHPILFYRLAGDRSFEWLHSDHSPYPVYSAFTELMKRVGLLASPPVSGKNASSAPKVSSFSGTYPLATVSFTGRLHGDEVESQLLYTWQRSYSLEKWLDVPSPPPAKVAVSFSKALKVVSVRDTVTLTPVLYKSDGNILSYFVSDNPIEVLFAPLHSAMMSETPTADSLASTDAVYTY